jgi:hypothetical protein
MNKLFYGAIVILALTIHSQFLMSFKSSNIESPHSVVVRKVKNFQIQKKETFIVEKSKKSHKGKD